MRRNRSWDIAKAVAIVLMVIGHCYSSENMILVWIYGFHMPLFFIISGLIYGEKTSREYRFRPLKAVKSYLPPYFLFEILYILLVVGLRVMAEPSEALTVLYQRGIAMITLLGTTVTWFLPCLLMVELLFFGLYYLFKKSTYIPLIISVGLYVLAMCVPAQGLLILLMRVCVGMGFFAVGFVSHRAVTALNQWSTGVLLAVCLLGAGIYAAPSLYNGQVSVVNMECGNPILYTLNAVLGSAWLLAVSVLCERYIKEETVVGRVINTFGQNTLFILGTHMPVIEVTRLIEHKLFHDVLHQMGWAEGLYMVPLFAE